MSIRPFPHMAFLALLPAWRPAFAPQMAEKSGKPQTVPVSAPVSDTVQKEITACCKAMAQGFHDKKPEAIIAFWSPDYKSLLTTTDGGKLILHEMNRADAIAKLKQSFPGNELAPKQEFVLRTFQRTGDKIVVDTVVYELIPLVPSEISLESPNAHGNIGSYSHWQQTWFKPARSKTWLLWRNENRDPNFSTEQGRAVFIKARERVISIGKTFG